VLRGNGALVKPCPFDRLGVGVNRRQTEAPPLGPAGGALDGKPGPPSVSQRVTLRPVASLARPARFCTCGPYGRGVGSRDSPGADGRFDMKRKYRFSATVTDLKTGKREQVSDTAHFDHPVSKADALSAIRNELVRQRRPGTGVTITD
jgi:hypothetical protein